MERQGRFWKKEGVTNTFRVSAPYPWMGRGHWHAELILIIECGGVHKFTTFRKGNLEQKVNESFPFARLLPGHQNLELTKRFWCNHFYIISSDWRPYTYLARLQTPRFSIYANPFVPSNTSCRLLDRYPGGTYPSSPLYPHLSIWINTSKSCSMDGVLEISLKGVRLVLQNRK